MGRRRSSPSPADRTPYQLPAPVEVCEAEWFRASLMPDSCFLLRWIHQLRSRVLGVEFLDERVRDLLGRTGPLFGVAPAPCLEVGIHLGRSVLHREGVDRGLEAVRQHALHFAALIPRLDLGRDVLPEHHLVFGHQAAASTSSASRVSSWPNPTRLTSSGRPRY